MKKQILIATTLLISSLQAQNLYFDAYLKQYKGDRSLTESKKLLKDSCFIKANEFLTKENKMKIKEFTEGDPELLKALKKVQRRMPDYPNALKTLKKCVENNGNPVAAYEGISIINSYLGKQNKENMQAYKLFSEILYKDKSCLGYLNYGDVYSRGVATKVNKQKALSIFKEGQKYCTGDWYKVVLEMRVNNTRIEKKK